MGSHASKQFYKNFKSMQGVSLAIVDINNSYNIFSNPYKQSLGTVLIAWKNKIIASSSQDNEQLFGYNQKYVWAVKKLQQLGIQIQSQQLNSGRIHADTSSGPVQLTKGLIAKFLFTGNIKDSSGHNTEFQLNSKSKLQYGKLLIDGSSYGTIRRSRTLTNSMGKTTKPFTVSLNFKQRKGEFLNKNVLFEIRNRFITVFNHNGKLTINVSEYGRLPGESDSKSYDEFYALEETNISYNQWHNIIFVWKPQQRRISIMIDGQRFKDVLISSKLKYFFSRINNDVSGVTFGRGGAPYGFYGAVDNLIIYNRALNHAEMKALYNKYKP